ncbi:hypothetical protein EYF80_028215 [Liparis tanakae]|uniref:Uncharacterized protein n=1 Tax=Liparis tanakae TaxID=230148 RepID=A0A4Z2H977_9TELE|nr:hypothetical protein EYF80_028215 [Liparis tanakae]
MSSSSEYSPLSSLLTLSARAFRLLFLLFFIIIITVPPPVSPMQPAEPRVCTGGPSDRMGEVARTPILPKRTWNGEHCRDPSGCLTTMTSMQPESVAGLRPRYSSLTWTNTWPANWPT